LSFLPRVVSNIETAHSSSKINSVPKQQNDTDEKDVITFHICMPPIRT